jgi:molecular chaperone DnaK (HSP70)
MSGRSQNVVITSDKGRLSEADIERMVREAEEHAEEDKRIRLDVEARNQLEAYLYSARVSVVEAGGDVVSDEEKEVVKAALDEAMKWLDTNANASKEDFDAKRQEVEAVVGPIVTASYSRSASSTGFSDGEDPTGGMDNDNTGNE